MSDTLQRARAVRRAFAHLSATPAFKGAVILLLAEDGKSVSMKSNLPADLVRELMRDVLQQMLGERPSGIIVS